MRGGKEGPPFPYSKGERKRGRRCATRSIGGVDDAQVTPGAQRRKRVGGEEIHSSFLPSREVPIEEINAKFG